MPPVAISRPSGRKATAWTKSVWPWNVADRRPEGTSQSLTLRSSLVVTRVRLSGLKARSRTNPSWAKIVSASAPVAASRSFTVLSHPPVASHFPSGLYARQ